MNLNINDREQDIINDTVYKTIVKNSNIPPKTVAKRLNKFLKTNTFSSETQLLIVLLVFNGLFSITE